MPGVRRAHLDRRVITRTKQVARSVDRDHRFAAEDVEPFFERVHVRVNRSTGCELVHAEARVDRSRRVIDQRGTAIAFAVPFEARVRAESRFREPPEMVH